MVDGGKFAVVAGATGSVGRLVVRTLLRDPRVSLVMAVVRKEVPADRAREIWGGFGDDGTANASGNNDVWPPNKISQCAVDFSKLKEEAENGGEETERLKGILSARGGRRCHAFLTSLGVYSSNASEDEMDEIEGDYNAAVAAVTKSAGATRGSYLSGAGVKQPSLEGTSLSSFGRAKGRAEERLAGIFQEGVEEGGSSHASCRPAAIFDRPGPPAYGIFDGTLMKMWPLKLVKQTRFGISADDIAKAMVQGALFDDHDHVRGNTIWENEALKSAAKRYDANFPQEME